MKENCEVRNDAQMPICCSFFIWGRGGFFSALFTQFSENPALRKYLTESKHQHPYRWRGKEVHWPFLVQIILQRFQRVSVILLYNGGKPPHSEYCTADINRGRLSVIREFQELRRSDRTTSRKTSTRCRSVLKHESFTS